MTTTLSEQLALATEPTPEQKIIVDGIVAGVAPVIAALRARIEELEKQAEKRLEYAGTWQRGINYRPGHIVTDAGSAWHCIKQNIGERPPGDGWVLMVKKGSDGKDSR